MEFKIRKFIDKLIEDVRASSSEALVEKIDELLAENFREVLFNTVMPRMKDGTAKIEQITIIIKGKLIANAYERLAYAPVKISDKTEDQP